MQGICQGIGNPLMSTLRTGHEATRHMHMPAGTGTLQDLCERIFLVPGMFLLVTFCRFCRHVPQEMAYAFPHRSPDPYPGLM